MIPAELIDRARAVTLGEAAQLLGLKAPRVGEYIGPCPACGGRDRFSVNARKGAWNCRGARGGRDAISLVEHVLAVDFRGAVEFLTGEVGESPQRIRPRPAPIIVDEPEAKTNAIGRELFAGTVDLRETLGDRYLSSERRLPGIVDDVLAQTIRFHRRCAFGTGKAREFAPAIVVALRSLDRVVRACGALGELEKVERHILSDISLVDSVMRIRLTEEGRKAGKALSLGTQCCDAVALCCSLWSLYYGEDEEAAKTGPCITIAEGLESALSMRAMGFAGTIALGGAGRLGKLQIPWTIPRVVIASENDEASRGAWNAAGERWSAAGHAVTIWRPPAGAKDANDLLRAKGARAA